MIVDDTNDNDNSRGGSIWASSRMRRDVTLLIPSREESHYIVLHQRMFVGLVRDILRKQPCGREVWQSVQNLHFRISLEATRNQTMQKSVASLFVKCWNIGCSNDSKTRTWITSHDIGTKRIIPTPDFRNSPGGRKHWQTQENDE